MAAALLVKTGYFPFFEREEVELFSSFLAEKQLARGEFLFRSGDMADGVYWLTAGKLAVVKTSDLGKRSKVIAILEEGAPVGENGLSTGWVRDSDLQALSACSLLHLDIASFQRYTAQQSHGGLRLVLWLASRTGLRLRAASDRMLHLL